MDAELKAYCINGDVERLAERVRQDPSVLKSFTLDTMDSPLHLASDKGHVAMVELILKKALELAKWENGRGETPLHKPSGRGFLDVVKVLLPFCGSVVDKFDCEDRSAFFAACEGGHLEVAKELRKATKSSTVEKLDRSGRSALFRAAEHGHLSVVVYLLSNTRLPELERDGRPTSLHVAARNGHADVVRKLLEKYSHMAWYSDDQGLTPMHLAARGGHIAATLAFWNDNKDLCLNVTSKDNLNPLHLAAIAGHSRVILEILKTDPYLAEVQTKKGDTILHLCIRYNKYPAMVDLLRNLNCLGINIVNVRDYNGNTILHRATIQMLLQMVKYLVNETNVDINALNINGLAALDVAKGAKAKAIISELEKAMAARSSLSGGDTVVNFSGLESKSSSLDSSEREGREGTGRGRNPHRLRLMKKKDRQMVKNNLITLCIGFSAAAYNGGMNPPGGFHQDGSDHELIGKAMLGSTTPYAVYVFFCYYAFLSAVGVAAILAMNEATVRLLKWCKVGTCSSAVSLVLMFATGLWMFVPHRAINLWVMLGVPGIKAVIAMSLVFLWNQSGGAALEANDSSDIDQGLGHGTYHSREYLENGSKLSKRKGKRHSYSSSSSSSSSSFSSSSDS